MSNDSQIFFPSSFQELFSIWRNSPRALLYAGGTELIRNQGRRLLLFPQEIISLNRMEELHKISRTERYLEIGAMVKLNQIINLGKIVPEGLSRCLQGIADPQLRNIATIGGNICNPHRRLDASVPLIALDAHLELRTASSSRWISASQFASLPGPPAIGNQEILSRIRIPLDPWTFTWYKKFRSPGCIEPGGGILFIIRNQKNILSNIRVVYSGKVVLRERNSETMLVGKKLPLEMKEARTFIENWKTYLSVFEGNEESIFPDGDGNSKPELLKAQIINFIESTLLRISD